MKRGIVLLALVGVASVALAQNAPAPKPAEGSGGRSMRMVPMRAHQRIRRIEQWRMHQLTVLLGLTPAQRPKVVAILREQRGAMRRNLMPFRNAVRRAMHQLRAAQRRTHRETLAKLSHVLSPEQLAKFKVLTPPRTMIRIRRMWHRGPPGPMGPPRMH